MRALAFEPEQGAEELVIEGGEVGEEEFFVVIDEFLLDGAAKRFFRKLLKALKYVPRAIIIDQLGSYTAAKKELLPSVEHRRFMQWRELFCLQPAI